MTLLRPATGVAFTCSQDGAIIEVLRDEVGITAGIRPGQMFPSLLERSSVQKGFGFLEELWRKQAAFNWVLNVKAGDEVLPLYFAGGMLQDHLLVVGAHSRTDIAMLYDELMKINNEQMNLLRQTLKDQIMQERAAAPREPDLYEELSRLNNELATTQRELAKKNAELERLNDVKNQFLGMAAHDLRNPLSVILSYSGFLLEESATVLEADQLDFLKIIQSSSEFMLELVNNLLDISKIENGKLELDLSVVDLLGLVRMNVARNRILAEKKRIQILLRHDEPIPELILDGHKIEQVLNNLIGNAIKFSPPGTSIEVHLAYAQEEARISVRDHGPGINSGDLERIFLPFTQAAARSTMGEQGAGLGLAIVKRIVQGHGGRIWIESAEGSGSAFYVSLPGNAFAPPVREGGPATAGKDHQGTE